MIGRNVGFLLGLQQVRFSETGYYKSLPALRDLFYPLIASTHLESGQNGCLGVNRFESLLMGTNGKGARLACCMLAINRQVLSGLIWGFSFVHCPLRFPLRAAHPVPNAQRLNRYIQISQTNSRPVSFTQRMSMFFLFLF